MIKSLEFANAAVEIYNKLVTTYAKGGYGQYINQATLTALENQYEWNKNHLTSNWLGTFATDCICWIKGELSGWRADVKITSSMYCKTIPDFTDAQWGAMLTDCVPIEQAKPGYGLWKKGHAGICIGNGYALDSNYAVKNGKVVENGLVLRKLTDVAWEKAGKCPYIDYSDQDEIKVGDVIPMTVTKIENGIAYGEMRISNPDTIQVGSRVTIDKGAKAGGLNPNYRGKTIDSRYANNKYIDTVVKIEKHYGEDEALLKGINTWVSFKYLNLVE